MSAYAGPEVVSSGLVLSLDAGNIRSYPGSGTTWTDLVGSKTGTLINGPTFSSTNGGSIVFDGVNDYASVTHTLSTPITVSGFVRYSSQVVTKNTFFNTSPHNVLDISLNRIGGGETYVYIGNGSAWSGGLSGADGTFPSIISSQTTSVNTWYHVTFTSTGSGSTLYFNGTSVGTSSFSPSGWGSSFYLGNIVVASEYLQGNISNVQIYSRALSAAEVKQNFYALRGRFGI